MKIKKIGEIAEDKLKEEPSEIKSDFNDIKFTIPKS